MAGRESTLTLRHVPEPTSDHLRMLNQAMRHDTTGGLVSPAEYIADMGGQVFEILDGDTLACAYLLSVNHWRGGAEGVVAYAGAESAAAGRMLLAKALPLIEKQFSGVRAVRIETRREELIRALVKRHGYRVDGVILRKTIRHES